VIAPLSRVVHAATGRPYGGQGGPPQVRIGHAMTAVHRAEVAHQRSLAKISRRSRRARAL
jgi:hypothetical protein